MVTVLEGTNPSRRTGDRLCRMPRLKRSAGSVYPEPDVDLNTITTFLFSISCDTARYRHKGVAMVTVPAAAIIRIKRTVVRRRPQCGCSTQAQNCH